MQKSCYNAHTKLLHKQDTTCQSELKEYQATMLNKEATQWPLYVENKTGIPMCITRYKQWMIDRREMPKAQESFDAGLAYH